MATYEDLVAQALARAQDFGQNVPATRSVMYRRLAVRQQHLFTVASRIDPEFYGAEAEGALNPDRAVDLRALAGAPSLDPSVGVQRVQVKDPGTSGLAQGTRVRLVSVDDVDADMPPRMTLRDFVLKAVGSDLDDVTSVCVFYPRYPDLIGAAEDGSSTIELAEAFTELLVVDLTRWLARKTLGLGPEVRSAMVADLTTEEGELLASYLEAVRTFGFGRSKRFSAPPETATR